VLLNFFIFKEIKRNKAFFSLVFIVLFLGLSGINAIELISRQVSGSIANNARQFLTSDLSLSARRNFTNSEEKMIRELASREGVITYKVIDLYSMVKSKDQSRLCEIRLVESVYPFYGSLEISDNKKYDSTQVYVSRDLAVAWNLQQADEIKIGELIVKSSGALINDTSLGLRGFSLAPRIYLPMRFLPQTDLIQPGITGSFSFHFKITSLKKLADFKNKLKKMFPDLAFKLMTSEESSLQSSRALQFLVTFMGLSSLIGLILALVGMFYFFGSYLKNRLKDFALLNLHGLTKHELLWGFLAQLTFIYVLVLSLQMLIFNFGYQWIMSPISKNLNLKLEGFSIRSTFSLQFLYLYFLVLSVMGPLFYGVLKTKLISQLSSAEFALSRLRWFYFIPSLILFWFVACSISQSFKYGSFYFAALMVMVLITLAIYKFLKFILFNVRKLKTLNNPILIFGLALRNFTRSGANLFFSFLTLVVASTLMTVIVLMKSVLVEEFKWDKHRPSLFLFDIQDEQIEPLQKFIQKRGFNLQDITPQIRARLEKVNGKDFQRADFSQRDFGGQTSSSNSRNNAVNLTYRDYLSSSEIVLESLQSDELGRFSNLPLISVEKNWARRSGIQLGSKLLFDIQGVSVEGVVFQIKDIKWTSFRPNFFITFKPGILEEAPKTYLATLPFLGVEKKILLQNDLVNSFPNVSMLDLEEVISKLSFIFEQSQYAIELISLFSLFIGLVVIYGLCHDQVQNRLHDIQLLKSLGLSRLSIIGQLLIEFGGVFLSALVIGLTFGFFMAQLLALWAFKVHPSFQWWDLGRLILILFSLSLISVFISSWRTVNDRSVRLL
jgi:putative ABC transport system permease protein